MRDAILADMDIREYREERTVHLGVVENGRICVIATNEGGYNSTAVDLLDLLTWLRANRPDLLGGLA